MAASNYKPRAVLQFNEYDFRHRKVLEILRSRKRHMSDMVVNAVLHYISCPEAETELSKDSIRKIVSEVIAEMAENGSLHSILSDSPSKDRKSQEEPFDFGDMMSAFRK